MKSHFIYHINPNAHGTLPNGKVWKGIVVCELTDVANDVIDKIDKEFEKAGFSSVIFENYQKYRVNNTYKGIAYCSIEDTFDEEIGKTVARERALAAFRRDKRRAFDNCLSNLYTLYLNLDNELNFLSRY